MNDTASPTPDASLRPARRSGRIAAIAAAAGLALLAGGVALGEAAGWPFLIPPLEKFLSSRLHREFSFRVPTPGDDRPPHASLRLVGTVRLASTRTLIAAPDWSANPHFLLARDASMELSWLALWQLWRRGSPLQIERLDAREIDIRTERLADGRTSWYFGDPQGTQRKRRGPPLIRELRVQQGRVQHDDRQRQIRFDVALTTVPGSTATASASSPQAAPARAPGLYAEGRGEVKGVPVSAALTLPGVARLSALDNMTLSADPARVMPALFALKAGTASFDFQGTIDDLLRRQGLRGAFRSEGRSLSAIGDALGLSLPTTAAYRMSGWAVAESRERVLVKIDDAAIGQSRMNAALVYERRGELPSLAGAIGGSRLALPDLLPSIGGQLGAPAKSPGRSLPAREFKLQSLRAMNANLSLAFNQLVLGGDIGAPLQSLATHLTLQRGTLSLADLRGRVSGGELRGTARLSAEGSEVQAGLKLRWKGVRTEPWARASGQGEPFLLAASDGHADLRGRGGSSAEILSHLDGRITTRLRNARVSKVVVAAAGGDLPRTLAAWLGGGGTVPVQCAAADLQVAAGVVRPRVLVIDTPDATLSAQGSLSLRDESLDLRIQAQPKRFSALSLRSPILVRGPLAAPKVSVDRAALGGRVGASVLLGLVNPLAAVLPLIDPGDDDGPVGCPSLAPSPAPKP